MDSRYLLSILIFEEITMDNFFYNFYKKDSIKNGYKQITNTDPLLEKECCICLSEYKIKEYKRELTCGHIFHKRCCDRWLKKNNTCPICREKFNKYN